MTKSNTPATTKTKRPNRISMEGMIWNANHVLDAALNPDNHGVPAELFQKCHGVVLLSVVQAGLIFTGHYGSGVLMAKHQDSKGKDYWSAPVAAGAMGYGGGAFVGAEVEDMIIFLLDRQELVDFATRPQTRLNLTGELTLGKHGREANLGLEAPGHKTATVIFSKGAFGGVGFEMGTLQVLKRVNSKFYDIPHIKTATILFDEQNEQDNVPFQVPTDKGIEELHQKLSWLAAGQTWTPGAQDVDKSERRFQQAQDAGKQVEAEQKEDIHYVELAPMPSV